tara:strand:- start:154 stop:549 length:396 start_codon:yes stop_codon:yes gene_type:complete
MIQVPVIDLLQITHPGYSHINNNPNLSHLPAILDYSRCLVERFEHYGNIEVSSPEMFVIICKMFETLTQDDDPAVILPIREKLPYFLEQFEAMIGNMCRAFSTNYKIKSLYSELSEYLYGMYDELTGGENK